LNVVVNGDQISLQLDCAGFTILATAYDYFDGCSHWVYLLRQDGTPIDMLSMPDEFGFIGDVTIVSSNEVAFGYFGTNDRWNIVVDKDGFWSYARPALVRRPNRFFLAKRYLVVRQTKGPPWSMPTPKLKGPGSI